MLVHEVGDVVYVAINDDVHAIAGGGGVLGHVGRGECFGHVEMYGDVEVGRGMRSR